MDTDCPVVIPYYGGKFTMSKQLLQYIPEHLRYFEPFFGGGSMFFRKKKANWNILNDIDNDLVNLYLCILNKFDELSEKIYWYPRSRKLHDDFRADIKATQEIDIPDTTRASKYYYIVRNAFNNKPLNSFSKDTYWSTQMIEELKQSKEKLNGSTIENLDFAELIDRYVIREGDFVYLDPPYVVADNRDYYRNRFDESMHLKLKETIDNISLNNGKFMLSYDDRVELREMYKDYNILTIKTKYSGANPDIRGEEKTELLILNYETNKQGVLF
tara:strand:- start:701 stop:1516 length:816 start_codon:yes stop_codon:yes gene_type:complete